MNRLSPMIRRRPVRSFAIAAPATAVGLDAASAWSGTVEPEDGDALEQLKLFATGWVGGLIFFGTYLG